jgi:hypothetical protein
MTHTLASYLTAKWVIVGSYMVIFAGFFTEVIFGVNWRDQGHVT